MELVALYNRTLSKAETVADALAHARSATDDLLEVTAADFPLPTLAPLLRRFVVEQTLKGESIERFDLTHGADATRDALSARLIREELGDATHDGRKVGRIVEDDSQNLATGKRIARSSDFRPD